MSKHRFTRVVNDEGIEHATIRELGQGAIRRAGMAAPGCDARHAASLFYAVYVRGESDNRGRGRCGDTAILFGTLNGL